MIKKRKLGKTDILVSEIGLGTYQLGGSSKINDLPIAFGNMDNETANNFLVVNTGSNNWNYQIKDLALAVKNQFKSIESTVYKQ